MPNGIPEVGPPVRQQQRVPVASVPEWGSLSRLQSAEAVRVRVPPGLHRDALRAGTVGLRSADAVQGFHHLADCLCQYADT